MAKKWSIEDFIEIAEKKGGKCLSETYKSPRVKLKFICKKGHIWQTNPQIITEGGWCKLGILLLLPTYKLKKEDFFDFIMENIRDTKYESYISNKELSNAQ